MFGSSVKMPGTSAPEIVADQAAVGFVGDVDEGRHCVGVEVVGGRVVVVPGGGLCDLAAQDQRRLAVAGLERRIDRGARHAQQPVAVRMDGVEPGAVEREHVCAGFDRRARDFERERLAPEGVAAARRHQPARRPGGPPVLVIEPGVHPHAARRLDHRAHGAHPRLAHVGRLQPLARVDEEAAHAALSHRLDLAHQLCLVEPVVPRPEGRAAMARGRVLETFA
ncbi:MAG: hypothetical protein M5R40_00945 [Anaerolineae bacterium]|nr:hypothetical protein [Anaerolineae bacterium]